MKSEKVFQFVPGTQGFTNYQISSALDSNLSMSSTPTEESKQLKYCTIKY